MTATGRILEGRNRANASEAASFVDQYEEFEKNILTIRGEFMNRVKVVREKQKELLDDAKGQGVTKKVVLAIVTARRHEGKAKAALEDLEDDDKTMAVDIRKALGDYADLPLGAAAVEREGPDETTSAIVEAASKGWAEGEEPTGKKTKPPKAVH